MRFELIQRAVVSFSALVFLYVLALMTRDLPEVYRNAMLWSQGNEIAGLGLVLFVASALLSALIVIFQLYKNERLIWSAPFLIHLLFVFPCLMVFTLVATIVAWCSCRRFVPY
ncbi:hypothetical protein [Vibrio sp. SCSIO 43137]|uniref:hypothetical protein n=1 Tax=Vibrio sp. SCSIO 43137 TaxID=3021011 RepID=UPI002307044F|nr:hypothetical protein [Vibrio sp. SCSIO 43137]WCE31814.1 hypothetical protein PK654_22070 [Vibrio sp. SCSIO 43137]